MQFILTTSYHIWYYFLVKDPRKTHGLSASRLTRPRLIGVLLYRFLAYLKNTIGTSRSRVEDNSKNSCPSDEFIVFSRSRIAQSERVVLEWTITQKMYVDLGSTLRLLSARGIRQIGEPVAFTAVRFIDRSTRRLVRSATNDRIPGKGYPCDNPR